MLLPILDFSLICVYQLPRYKRPSNYSNPHGWRCYVKLPHPRARLIPSHCQGLLNRYYTDIPLKNARTSMGRWACLPNRFAWHLQPEWAGSNRSHALRYWRSCYASRNTAFIYQRSVVWSLFASKYKLKYVFRNQPKPSTYKLICSDRFNFTRY